MTKSYTIQTQGKEDEMEKLVEEIAKEIFALHAWPRGETDWDRAIKQAEKLTTRIGQAILSGESKELDEMLGVVGRRDLGASPYAPTEWAWTMIGKGARTFIAIRKEEEK